MRSLLITLVVIVAAEAGAQDLTFKITGVVKQLDLKNGTVAILPTRKGAVVDEKYSFLKKDVNVTTPNGQKTTLDTIKLGQTIQLTIGGNGDVEAVAIQTLAYVARVAEVNAGARTIKIAQENKQTTLGVADSAKIWIASRPAFLREVKPGSEMTVNASLDGKTVHGLNLISDPEGKLANKLYPRVKVSKLPGSRIVGTLTDIDAAKNEFIITGPKTKNQPRRLPVAKDAVIQAIYWQVAVQNLALKDLGKTARGTVLVSAQDQATHIIVDPPTLRARVKSLDGERGLLTAKVEGADKAFALPGGFKVMNGTRVMRLCDLQSDLAVNLVFSLDRQQLLAVDLRTD